MWKIQPAKAAGAIAVEWAPKVLRLFQLCLGNQVMAESLTIDTLAEAVRQREAITPNGIPVGLLRRALAKAEQARTVAVAADDPVVRAVAALPSPERAAVVLFRGIALDLDTVALVMRLDVRTVKRLCTNAILSVQRSLSGLPVSDQRGEDE